MSAGSRLAHSLREDDVYEDDVYNEGVQPTPIIPLLFEAVDAPTEPTTVVDLLLKVAGLVGIIIIIALLAGALIAGLLVGVRRRWPENPFNGRGSDRTRLDLSGLSDGDRR